MKRLTKAAFAVATACAIAMQKTMAELGVVVTPAGGTVRLAMKAAVAVGAARRFLAGDPGIQLMDVLAGRMIDALPRPSTSPREPRLCSMGRRSHRSGTGSKSASFGAIRRAASNLASCRRCG